MDSRKINRDLLLIIFLFGLAVIAVVAVERMFMNPDYSEISSNTDPIGLLLLVLVIGATLGSCLIAGLFISFSDFVMKSINRLPREQSTATFNIINETVQPASGRSASLLVRVLIITAILCVLIFVLALVYLENTGTLYLTSGSVFYLLSFLITVIYHIPRNNRLMAIFKEQDTKRANEWWDLVASGWTLWNSVRGGAALSAVLLFLLALRAGAV